MVSHTKSEWHPVGNASKSAHSSGTLFYAMYLGTFLGTAHPIYPHWYPA
jgi:hypothetical protein